MSNNDSPLEPEPTVFILRKRHWAFDGEGHIPKFDESVKAYQTREAAKEAGQLMENSDPAPLTVFVSPFWNDSDVISSQDESELYANAVAAELPLPAEGNTDFPDLKYDWADWWYNLNPDQTITACPWIVRAFVIVEIPLNSVNVVSDERAKGSVMPKLFVIHIFNEDDRYTEGRESSGKPLHAFSTAAEAKRFCDRHWKEDCADRYPFHYVREDQTVSVASNFEPEILHDWLLEHVGESPTLKQIREWHCWRWEEWWYNNVAKLPEETRLTVWEAFDKADFFQVVELQLDEA